MNATRTRVRARPARRRRTIRELLAVHEAGHAVVAVLLGQRVLLATILPSGIADGVCFCGDEPDPETSARILAAGDVAVHIADVNGRERLRRSDYCPRWGQFWTIDPETGLPSLRRPRRNSAWFGDVVRRTEHVLTTGTESDAEHLARIHAGANLTREQARESVQPAVDAAWSLLVGCWSAVELVAEELVIADSISGDRVKTFVDEAGRGRVIRPRVLPDHPEARAALHIQKHRPGR